MKLFYQTIIFFFIALSLFILRDDVVSVIDHIYSRIEKKAETSLVQFEDKKEVQLPGKIDMPGALRVLSGAIKDEDAELSQHDLILLTNGQRKENGNLMELRENNILDLSAEEKLQDMFDNQYFEHISPKGIGVADLSEEVGYEYILIGENLAMGNFKDDSSLINAWMSSAGHRANILNEHYTDIGMAIGKGNFEGKDIWMAVQHFGTPRSICPEIDQVLLGVINLDQYKIKEMETDLKKRRKAIDENNQALYEGSTFTEQVDEYNSLIIPYNNLIAEIKKRIDVYNNQVHAFNVCLTEHQ
jgi:uncharacterized protein YkwD